MPSTPVRDIELIEVGSLGKETLSNDSFTNLSLGISGAATIPLSSTDHTLTTTNDGEAMRFVLILTGTLTANVNLLVPAESRVYVVDNRTTGAFTVTCRPAAGGGIAVEQNARTLIYCDGSNVYPVASGTGGGGGGSGAPTDASYLVGASHTLLSGERVVTDTATITWDLGTAGQARALIPPDAVSYAHIQNVTPTRLLGRFTVGSGDVQEITPGTGLTLDAGGVLSATAVGQPLDATLTALANLTTGANLLPYFTGVDTVTTTTLSAFVRTLLDDGDAATARSTLGAQASDATLTALAGVTTGADTLPFFTGTDLASTTVLTAFMRGLLDDPDQATAQATLGITGGGGGLDTEQVQDIVGAMATDSATIDYTYDDTAGTFTSIVKDASITEAKLSLSDVTSQDASTTAHGLLRKLSGTATQYLDGTGAWTIPAGGGGGGSTTMGAIVTRVATMNITTATTTAVSFDTEVRDDSTFYAAGQPTRLTAPSTGWYVVSAWLAWDANTGGDRIVELRYNNTTYVPGQSDVTPPQGLRQNVAMAAYMAAGEYVEVTVYQTSGTTRTLTGGMSIAAVAGGVANSYLGLTDTPDTYSGQAGKVVRVNAGATATEFGPVLGSMAAQDAGAVAITGGAISVPRLGVNTAAPGTDGWAVVQGRVGVNQPSPAYALDVSGQARVTTELGINIAPVASFRTYIGANQADYGLVIKRLDSDAVGYAMAFTNVAAGLAGSITYTGSATAFNTSSDARLKHAVAALTGALERIAALKPVTFRWQSDDTPGQGFLAHELQQVLPEAVTGEPDAVNADGSIRPQQVDHSKIIPWLVGAIQELAARLDAVGA